MSLGIMMENKYELLYKDFLKILADEYQKGKLSSFLTLSLITDKENRYKFNNISIENSINTIMAGIDPDTKSKNKHYLLEKLQTLIDYSFNTVASDRDKSRELDGDDEGNNKEIDAFIYNLIKYSREIEQLSRLLPGRSHQE